MHITLNSEQARLVVVDHLADTVILRKQYLRRCDIDHYKYVIEQLASLVELEELQQRFDKSWPSDVKWDC